MLKAVVVAAIGLATPVSAQTVGKPAAAEKAVDTKAAGAATAFAAGTKAFEGGKTEAAVAALTAAISTGGLKNPDLAKAMFYRGVAYRTQKKPAAALSDLNAAVWLREGLSATDKAVAEDHRQALLREVAALNGAPASAQTNAATPIAAPAPAPPVAHVTPPMDTVAMAPAAAAPEPEVMPWAAADPAPAAVAAPPEIVPKSADEASRTPPSIETAALPANDAPAPVAGTAALAESAHDTVEEPVATVAPVERAQIATVEATPAPPEKPLPWLVATNEPPPAASATAETTALPWGVPASPAPVPATTATAQVDPPVPAAAPVTIGFASDAPSAQAAVPSVVVDAPAALADAGKAAGAFVSSLFGGGADAPAAEPAAAASAVPNNAAPIETAALPERPTPPDPAPAVWTAETAAAPAAVAERQPAAEVKVAAAEAVPNVAVLPGPYRLQIAAENSRADAEQTWSRLVSGHGTALRGLEPVIEEPATGGILFGSMGAAYRVSIGPYASSMEPGRLCNILKPHGFDCRVVAVTP